jgi:hypothetical protein
MRTPMATSSIIRAAACGALGLALAGCATAAPAPAPAPAPTPVASAAPTAAGEPAATERAVPVYYIADTAAGPRLYREFHRLTTADPGSAAVREMLASSSGQDPDYRSYWPPGTTLHVPVEHAGGVITVDLSGVGPAPAGDLASLTIQQLVFTVQAALQSTDPVRILVDGALVPEVWGVDTREPVPRGDPYALRSLVQIDEPAEGAVLGRDVLVSGEAAVFEATVVWQVLRGAEVVQSGFTTSAEGQRFAPYSFTVSLEPGEYTVLVTEDDPSGGEGRPPLTDDKTITVR